VVVVVTVVLVGGKMTTLLNNSFTVVVVTFVVVVVVTVVVTVGGGVVVVHAGAVAGGGLVVDDFAATLAFNSFHPESRTHHEDHWPSNWHRKPSSQCADPVKLNPPHCSPLPSTEPELPGEAEPALECTVLTEDIAVCKGTAGVPGSANRAIGVGTPALQPATSTWPSPSLKGRGPPLAIAADNATAAAGGDKLPSFSIKTVIGSQRFKLPGRQATPPHQTHGSP
jgi:hypothetical protein